MANFHKAYHRTKGPINFQFYGNWDVVQNNLRKIPKELHSSALWGQRKSAERYARMVKDHIINDDLRLTRKKNKWARDQRPLVKTQTMANAIKAWRKNYKYYVGIPVGEMDANSVIELRYLAAIQEHGNKQRGIPARPVWGPTYREFGGANMVKKITLQTIQNKIKKLGLTHFDVTYKGLFYDTSK